MADKEINQVGALGEIEFLAQAISGALNPAHAQCGELGNLLGGEVEAQQGAEAQVGWRECRILSLEFLEEILVDEVLAIDDESDDN